MIWSACCRMKRGSPQAIRELPSNSERYTGCGGGGGASDSAIKADIGTVRGLLVDLNCRHAVAETQAHGWDVGRVDRVLASWNIRQHNKIVLWAFSTGSWLLVVGCWLLVAGCGCGPRGRFP